MLAEAGLVEEAPELARDRRERWWRLVDRRHPVEPARLRRRHGGRHGGVGGRSPGPAPSAVRAHPRLDGQRRRATPSGTTPPSPPSTGCGSPPPSSRARRRGGRGAAPLARPHGRLTTACTASRSSCSPAASRPSREPRTTAHALWAPPLPRSPATATSGCSGSARASVGARLDDDGRRACPWWPSRRSTPGPGWMGVLTAAAWLPWLVIGLPAGAWVDRADARRVMIAADLGAAVPIGSVPVAWALGLLTLPHLVLAALGVGTATVFLRAAYLPLVPPPRRPGRPRHRRTPGWSAPSRRCRSPDPASADCPRRRWSRPPTPSLVDVVSFLVSALCLHLDGPRTGCCPALAARRREPLRRGGRDGIRVVPTTASCGSSPSWAVSRTSRSPVMHPARAVPRARPATSTRAASAS